MQFQLFMEQNSSLINNKFLKEFISNKPKEHLEELINEIKYEKNELVELLNSKININKEKLKDLLDNLGELNENYKINKNKYGEDFANIDFYS